MDYTKIKIKAIAIMFFCCYALALWTKYDFERPDYKAYVKRMKLREKVKPVIDTTPLPADKSVDKKVSWTTPK